MKILFITPRFPYPPNRGDRLRYYNFAKVLSKDHELHLASLIQSSDDLRYLNETKTIFRRVETVHKRPVASLVDMAIHFFSDIPLQVSYFHSLQMHRLIERMVEKERYDAVYVFHLRMAPYAVDLRGVYRILDLTDAVSLFLERMADHKKLIMKHLLLRESRITRRYEERITKLFDECWIISDEDKKALGTNGNSSSVFVVPNGIDADYFMPDLSHRDRGPNILFVGYMGAESISTIKYFLKEIFPAVRRAIPSVKFYIVGANPPREIVKLTRDKNIVVTGYIKDLRPLYNNAAVMAAPMRFVAGVQNKILEAMAMGVAVVTSSFGNEGINAKHGENIFVEDDPRIFACRVIELLKDKKLGEKIGRNAIKFVREKYSWNSVVSRMDKVEEAITKK